MGYYVVASGEGSEARNTIADDFLMLTKHRQFTRYGSTSDIAERHQTLIYQVTHLDTNQETLGNQLSPRAIVGGKG